jgi:hypothetical protein
MKRKWITVRQLTNPPIVKPIKVVDKETQLKTPRHQELIERQLLGQDNWNTLWRKGIMQGRHSFFINSIIVQLHNEGKISSEELKELNNVSLSDKEDYLEKNHNVLIVREGNEPKNLKGKRKEWMDWTDFEW